jgi:hypothetical protein
MRDNDTKLLEEAYTQINEDGPKVVSAWASGSHSAQRVYNINFKEATTKEPIQDLEITQNHRRRRINVPEGARVKRIPGGVFIKAEGDGSPLHGYMVIRGEENLQKIVDAVI